MVSCQKFWEILCNVNILYFGHCVILIVKSPLSRMSISLWYRWRTENEGESKTILCRRHLIRKSTSYECMKYKTGEDTRSKETSSINYLRSIVETFFPSPFKNNMVKTLSRHLLVFLSLSFILRVTLNLLDRSRPLLSVRRTKDSSTERIK